MRSVPTNEVTYVDTVSDMATSIFNNCFQAHEGHYKLAQSTLDLAIGLGFESRFELQGCLHVVDYLQAL